MKNNKFGIPVIVILLIVALPAAIYGLVYSGILEKEAGNPKHLPKLGNKLYYYNQADELIGYYECKSSECGEAVTSVEDDTRTFSNGFNGVQIGVFNEDKIFINDNGIKYVKLSPTGGTVLQEVKFIKNYDGIISPFLIYVDMDNLYYLLNIETGMPIAAGEDKIIVDMNLDSTYFGIGRQGRYQIYTQEFVPMGIDNSLEIIDFDETGIIIYKDEYSGTYSLYTDWGKTELIKGITEYLLMTDFNVIQTDEGVKIYSKDLRNVLSEQSGSDIKFAKEDAKIVYYSDGKQVGSYLFGQENNPEVPEDIPTDNPDTPEENPTED